MGLRITSFFVLHTHDNFVWYFFNKKESKTIIDLIEHKKNAVKFIREHLSQSHIKELNILG